MSEMQATPVRREAERNKSDYKRKINCKKKNRIQINRIKMFQQRSSKTAPCLASLNSRYLLNEKQ
ncbi:MAG: hypothetical protein IPN57_04755 [Ignavibacteria bacterium]|nr:hypothetical protein [Ignavibacteria bacterium]